MAKIGDFQGGTLSLVWIANCIQFSALLARPLSSDGKMGRTIWRKLAIFEEDNLSLVGFSNNTFVLALEVVSSLSLPERYMCGLRNF